MRTAKYRTSKPGKPDVIKYSIREIRPEEWREIVTALDGLYSGLALEMVKQMRDVDETPDLDAAAGRGFDD